MLGAGVEEVEVLDVLLLDCVLALGVLVSLAAGAEVVGVVGVTLGEADVVLSLEALLCVLSFPLLLLFSAELLSLLVVPPLSSPSFPPVEGSLVLGISVFGVSGVTIGSLGSAGVLPSSPLSVSGVDSVVSSVPFSV